MSREIPPRVYVALALVRMLLFAGAFWLGRYSIPPPPPQPHVYRLVRHEQVSHKPRSAIVRAYSEQDARRVLAERWSDPTWRSEEGAACWREDATKFTGVLLESVTP